MTNLGSVLIAMEEYPRACEVLAERVDRSRRVLGPTHPDTLDAMFGLARALCGTGDRASGRAPLRAGAGYDDRRVRTRTPRTRSGP
jgi:hypothetical protein